MRKLDFCHLFDVYVNVLAMADGHPITGNGCPRILSIPLIASFLRQVQYMLLPIATRAQKGPKA